MMKSNNFIII